MAVNSGPSDSRTHTTGSQTAWVRLARVQVSKQV